jgi:hypothetical protein
MQTPDITEHCPCSRRLRWLTPHLSSVSFVFTLMLSSAHVVMPHKKYSKFLLVVTLFVLLGQAVASSFMVCPNMAPVSHAASTALEDHCAGMKMSVNPADSLQASPQTSSSDNLQSVPHCNFICQYCRMNMMDASDLFPLNAPPPRTWANALSVSPPATQLIDNHFRPPAIA